MSFAPGNAEFKPQTNYQCLAEKLEDVATILRQRTHLDRDFADRLAALAGHIRKNSQANGPAAQSERG